MLQPISDEDDAPMPMNGRHVSITAISCEPLKELLLTPEDKVPQFISLRNSLGSTKAHFGREIFPHPSKTLHYSFFSRKKLRPEEFSSGILP